MVLISDPPFRMLEFLAKTMALCFLYLMEEKISGELLASPETNDPEWTTSNKQAGETAWMQVAEAGARESVLDQNPEHAANCHVIKKGPF